MIWTWVGTGVWAGSARKLGVLAIALLGGSSLLWGAACASQSGKLGRAAEPEVTLAAAPDSRFLEELLPLVRQPTTQRATSLAQLADAGSVRARYLLASDALAAGQPEAALEWLENLDADYPVLAPYVRLLQARALEARSDRARAWQLLSDLQQEFPDSAAAAIAACELREQTIPQHPCSWELARQKLAGNPNDFEALLLLARYQPRASEANGWRDRLVKIHGARLNGRDWEAIASGYWQTWEYDKAANAYQKTARSPKHLYRIGRGRHLSNRKAEAKRVYLQVLRDFPTAAESGWALRRLAEISPANEALVHLERAIAEFPEQAPEALLAKAGKLDRLGDLTGATAARNTLLENYPNSEAAREYRWQQARKAWLAGNLAEAQGWAAPVDMAKAQFWVAKWQQQQGQTAAARAQFERVLQDYPDSYYAWRSAVHLGHEVGNFTNARTFSPPVASLADRTALPAGSAAVSELYLLGQDRDAYGLWQYETADLAGEFSVAEQFADGVLQLTQGNHLVGINRVWKLKDREEPEARSQWLDLQQQPAYWQALYPLPFEQPIRAWSQTHQLNPLLVASLIRQESRFEPKIRSRSNAAGLMQILPSTGKWISGKIGQPRYSLDNPEDNVKFGTWYLRYTHERYGNNSMLAVASYNGGPGNVAKWVNRFGLQDEDRFVELIPFAETKGYVESVFGNYWNYLRLHSPETIPAGAELFPRN